LQGIERLSPQPGAGRQIPLALPPRAATQVPHAPTPARVELRIDQLVLEGVERADAPAVAAAVERELGRLLTAERGWGSDQRRDRIDAGAIDLPGRGSPELLGARIARAVHRGIMRGQGR
jgi:hypothetical protein